MEEDTSPSSSASFASCSDAVALFSAVASEEFQNLSTDHSYEDARKVIIKQVLKPEIHSSLDLPPVEQAAAHNIVQKFGVHLSQEDIHMIALFKSEIKALREGSHNDHEIVNILSQRLHTLPKSIGEKRKRVTHTIHLPNESGDVFVPKKQKLTTNHSSRDETISTQLKKKKHPLVVPAELTKRKI